MEKIEVFTFWDIADKCAEIIQQLPKVPYGDISWFDVNSLSSMDREWEMAQAIEDLWYYRDVDIDPTLSPYLAIRLQFSRSMALDLSLTQHGLRQTSSKALVDVIFWVTSYWHRAGALWIARKLGTDLCLGQNEIPYQSQEEKETPLLKHWLEKHNLPKMTDLYME